MKKILLTLAVVFMATVSGHAQSAAELAKQQRELNKINMELLNSKPSKSAKKQAKKMTKEGWIVPSGMKDLAGQLTQGQLMGEELMTNEAGQIMKRYILHTATTVSGSESTAYSAARSVCQQEVAAMLETKIIAAFKGKADNAETSAITATTVDKFNQRARGISEATLTMMIPIVHTYRVLPNKNFQTQVQLAYDKKEMHVQLKRQLAKELEAEGDELEELVDEITNEVISSNFQ